MKKQNGLTLIQVIVAIVILGILAAMALPKMTNLSGDARFAVMKGAEGSMRAANSLIYARAVSLGIQSAATGVIPAHTMGNTAAINIEFGFAATVTDLVVLMDLSSLTDLNIGAMTLQHAKAEAPANCQITYTKATTTAGPLYANNGTAVNCS